MPKFRTAMDNVIIIGGGLAGLTAAIHLSKAGVAVSVFEKNEFPRHKVCGEYLSNEAVLYLESLGVDLAALNPKKITRTLISTVSGKHIGAKLPLGGLGISRYALDHALYRKAVENGCEIVAETVSDISFSDGIFTLTTSAKTEHHARIVLGAFGKRSNIDLKLRRRFTLQKSPWLAVKAHYRGDFPDDLVALHNFRGGYCGVSKVETGAINICYLADYASFKKYKDVEEYQKMVVGKNPMLAEIFNNEPVFKPIAISQISFADKLPVENHMLMIGDTVGVIHPLCGNGMAMAIHSAKLASGLTIDYFSGKIQSRKSLEKSYAIAWNTRFRRRIETGKFIAAILRREKAAAFLMNLLIVFPSVLPVIIRKTHGKTTLS